MSGPFIQPSFSIRPILNGSTRATNNTENLLSSIYQMQQKHQKEINEQLQQFRLQTLYQTQKSQEILTKAMEILQASEKLLEKSLMLQINQMPSPSSSNRGSNPIITTTPFPSNSSIASPLSSIPFIEPASQDSDPMSHFFFSDFDTQTSSASSSSAFSSSLSPSLSSNSSTSQTGSNHDSLIASPLFSISTPTSDTSFLEDISSDLPSQDSDLMILPDSRASSSSTSSSSASPSLSSISRNRSKKSAKKTFTCKKCSRVFDLKRALTNHKKTHTSNPNYLCKHCDVTFTNKLEYYDHLKKNTVGERIFKCSYSACDKTFSDYSNCKRHIIAHTGEKPYKCQVPDCSKRFSRSANLRTHLKTVHKGAE